eukprot:10643802-Lingulodinium_polyedra.AAC.1
MPEVDDDQKLKAEARQAGQKVSKGSIVGMVESRPRPRRRRRASARQTLKIELKGARAQYAGRPIRGQCVCLGFAADKVLDVKTGR